MSGTRPRQIRRRVLYAGALLAGSTIAAIKRVLPTRRDPPAGPPLPLGLTVVIPSRSGLDLLARLLPGLEQDLIGTPSEIVVVDNGSDDGSAAYLRDRFPAVIVDEVSGPLSFAAAVNRGIRRARFRYVCLLNNDMVVQPDFSSELLAAFTEIRGLFCATAQIFFPQECGGRRRARQ